MAFKDFLIRRKLRSSCLEGRRRGWIPAQRFSGWRPAVGPPLTPRTVTPARRTRRPSLVFEPLSGISGFHEAAAAAFGVAVFFLNSRFALAAEFFHTRTDRRKVVGSAGSRHVSSSSLSGPRRGRRWFVKQTFRPCSRMGKLRASENQGADARRPCPNVMCTFAAMSLNGMPPNSEASIILIMFLAIEFRSPVNAFN